MVANASPSLNGSTSTVPATLADSDVTAIAAANNNNSDMPQSVVVGDTEHPINKIPHILPHQRVFPIQIGGKLFNLSGASISSDAPSYFSQYFLCQMQDAEVQGNDACSAIKTLCIDRDPTTFQDISLHLQGYHVAPRDGTHYVRLFADAQFYNLPKLMAKLAESTIFITIGNREFNIPRDLFADPGNTPNFFSVGFGAFFSNPDDLFPGLNRDTMIRPPSLMPPVVPNRSPDIFAELLRLLRGYPVSIRDAAHRQELLRDARYFHFKGLEQKLIPHTISFNQSRQRDEITLRLENVQKSGISVVLNDDDDDAAAAPSGWVRYARPFVDDKPAELILEIGGETTRIHYSPDAPRAEFFRGSGPRVTRLFELLAAKLNLPDGNKRRLGFPDESRFVRVHIPPEASVVLDDQQLSTTTTTTSPGAAENHIDPAQQHNPLKRRRQDSDYDDSETWIVRTAQWRLRIQPSKTRDDLMECMFVAVKIDAVSSELGRNKARAFLG